MHFTWLVDFSRCSKGNAKFASVPENAYKTVSCTYDDNGNLREVTDRNGVSTTYKYDAFGRLTEENAGGNEKSYTYDKAGNVLTAVNGV